MKKISTIILFLASFVGYSQAGAMATFDFTQALNMTEAINSGLEQLDKLDRMIDYYQKVEEKIQKVNRVILKLDRIRRIVSDQRFILNSIEQSKNFITKLENSTQKRIYVNNLRNILYETQEASQELSEITRDDFLNLSDKDRLELIEKNEKKIKRNKARLKLMYNVKE